MCTKTKSPPKAAPIPPPPPNAEPGQLAPIIDDGTGIAQKIQSLQGLQSLLIPYTPVQARPRNLGISPQRPAPPLF